MPGNSCPRAMPTMMQSATQKVRKRSKTPIADLAAGAAPAAVAVSLMKTSDFGCSVIRDARVYTASFSGTAQQAFGRGSSQQVSAAVSCRRRNMTAAGASTTAVMPQQKVSSAARCHGPRAANAGLRQFELDACGGIPIAGERRCDRAHLLMSRRQQEGRRAAIAFHAGDEEAGSRDARAPWRHAVARCRSCADWDR